MNRKPTRSTRMARAKFRVAKAKLRVAVPLLVGGLAVIAVATQMRVADEARFERLAHQEACIALGGTVVLGEKGAAASCLTSVSTAREAVPEEGSDLAGTPDGGEAERLLQGVGTDLQNQS